MYETNKAKRDRLMTFLKTGMTCHITAYEIQDPDRSNDPNARKWIAKAVAQVYDPNTTVPQLTAAQTVLTGEVIRLVEGRAYCETEAGALQTALEALLFKLDALRRRNLKA